MADRPRKPSHTNPFYVVLLVVSTLFVVTALGYLVGPFVQRQAVAPRPGPMATAGAGAGPGRSPRPGSLALAGWLDRHGPLALAVEFGLMFVTGLLAMATEHWFAARAKAKPARSPAPEHSRLPGPGDGNDFPA